MQTGPDVDVVARALVVALQAKHHTADNNSEVEGKLNALFILIYYDLDYLIFSCIEYETKLVLIIII